MIWKSTLIMTIIDISIIVMTLILFWNYYQNRYLLRKLRVRKGIALIVGGFSIMSLLYFLDIIAMHVLPILLSKNKSMAIMKEMHLNYNWILSALGFGILFFGLILLNKVLFPSIIRHQEELKKLSITDELTGLLNRRGFFAIAKKHCKIASRTNLNFSLVYIDFDGMKFINDEYGHQEGDAALIDTAKILKESFRSSDIIARIGGDEFVAITMETPETDFGLLTKRLRANLEYHNKKTNKPYVLSLSLGFSRFSPDKPCSIDELISKADKFMYKNKEQSK